MNKTELRIGNMIRDIESGRIGTVLTLGTKKCTVKMEFSKLMQDYDEFEPIPLSEEWLLKCGFDNVRNNMLTCHNEYHNNRINEGAFFVEPVGDAFNHWYLYHKVKMITSNIRFVHQLQNLFFSLTGEELTIKN